MIMLGIIIFLFVAAIVTSFVIPNKMVSNHPKDHEA
jgi:hypothetical protein